MIRVAIVEDEGLYVKQLQEYLKKLEDQEKEEISVTIFRDGDGITNKYKAQFDIILMDIEMKFMDGMSAAEEIRKVDSEVVIIFITNMAQYAIKGYEVGALDYILKPVTYFSFSQKFKKAMMNVKKRSSNYITVSVKGGVQRIDTSDIYYIESDKHTLIFHTKNGEVISSVTMKAVEQVLADLPFAKGNKCYLINLEHVDGIKDKCAMVKGEQLILSRSGQKSFMKELAKYWGEAE